MFNLREFYPYLEEVNPGILRLLPRLDSASEKSPRRLVLDVGCGRAALGQAISQLGYEVWGIESNGEACATASTRLARLVRADLTQTELIAKELEGVAFDYLLFSDVLEHVYDPLEMLKFYCRFLRGDGRVLISLPNIANWQERSNLLLGRFNYSESGVMDRTHIRFFTFQTARRLVEEAGLAVERLDCDPYLVRAALPLIKRFSKLGASADAAPGATAALLNSPAYRLYSRWVYPVEHRISSLWKSLLSFRIILVAKAGKAI